jgi:hypothetical protein
MIISLRNYGKVIVMRKITKIKVKSKAENYLKVLDMVAFHRVLKEGYFRSVRDFNKDEKLKIVSKNNSLPEEEIVEKVKSCLYNFYSLYI